MRIYFILLVSFLALVTITLAHGNNRDEIIVNGKTITAGTTPDSFFYNLDVAIDRIRYLLTFNSESKAKIGLEIARERLLEVREMILENKTNSAKKAQNEHEKSLERVEKFIKILSRSNSTNELETELKFEKELEKHETEIETINDELKIKIITKGNITEEQQALIDSIINLLQNKTGEVKIKIENKKGETKIKIKIETGKTDEEVEDEVEKLENKTGLLELKKEKAEEEIEDAIEELEEVKAKLALNLTLNITAVNTLISQAEIKISEAQVAFNESKFGRAFGLANAAERLAGNAEKILDKLIEEAEEEEENEIEIEIKSNVSKIEVEINATRLKYTLQTTNLTEVLQDISSKTGLSIDAIKAIAEIKIEEDEEMEEVGPKTFNVTIVEQIGIKEQT